MQKKLTVFAATMMMSVPTLGLAAMAGSNTVNSAAIVDGSIATADIANSAVTAAKIASGTITATQLATGSVTATQIAAGAVTDAKITGPISLSKLPVGTSATTVAAGNHTHSGAVKYAQVVVVAKTGGDSSNPASAVAAIADASATKPYLVRVMPGVYDLGNTSLKMKPYIYVEGSGDSSVITSTVTNADGQCFTGTVNMANNSTLKNIAIKNINSGSDNHVSGVVFSDAVASIDSVNIFAGSDLNNYNEVSAVCSRGASAKATVTNSILETRSATGNSDTVSVTDNSSMSIDSSRIIAVGGSSTHVVDCHNFQSNPADDRMSMANFTLTNSYVEGTAPDNNEIIWGFGCQNTTILNSTIIGNDSGWTYGVTTNRNTTIINSRIHGGINYEGGVMNVANSVVGGGITSDPNVKLCNVLDENFTRFADNCNP